KMAPRGKRFREERALEQLRCGRELRKAKNGDTDDLRRGGGQPSAARWGNDAAFFEEGHRQQVEGKKNSHNAANNVGCRRRKPERNNRKGSLRQSQSQQSKEDPAATEHCAQGQACYKDRDRKKPQDPRFRIENDTKLDQYHRDQQQQASGKQKAIQSF